MGDLQIVRDLPDYTIATYRNVLIQIWRLSCPPEGVAVARNAARQIAAQGTHALGLLVIVPEKSELPGLVARQELNHIPKDMRGRLAAIAIVIEGTGFRSAAVRGIATTVAAFSRTDANQQILPNVRAAIDWLAEQSALGMRRDDLLRVTLPLYPDA